MTPAKHQQNWLPGIFNDFFGNEWIAKTSSAAPAINIVETEKEYEVQIAAPGITKDDFDITVDKENHLVVTVEHKQEEGEKDKKGRYLRREFSYSQFQQTLALISSRPEGRCVAACGDFRFLSYGDSSLLIP